MAAERELQEAAAKAKAKADLAAKAQCDAKAAAAASRVSASVAAEHVRATARPVSQGSVLDLQDAAAAARAEEIYAEARGSPSTQQTLGKRLSEVLTHTRHGCASYGYRSSSHPPAVKPSLPPLLPI